MLLVALGFVQVMQIDRRHLTVLLLLCSCASDRFSLGATTAPGDASEVQVLGRRPRVSVENEGPGRLHVHFDAPGDAWDDSVTLGVGVTMRTLPGPVRVRLEPLGDERAIWRLVARESTGLNADLLLEREALSRGKR